MFLSWFRYVVLSYIHVDGDFNPRRVTVARVHGELHPRRVHEEATLSIPPWPSQVTPNQSRRHHSPKGNRWCVDDELLALLLQMIVSPTLNSLSQIWIWWKDDLSGKQLGEG